MNKLSILHIVQGFDWTGGTGTNLHVNLLSKCLSADGYDVSILSSSYRRTCSSAVIGAADREVEVKVVRTIVKLGHYGVSAGMLPEIINADPDIIHVHGYRNFASDVGALAARILGVPFVLTPHGSVMGFAFQKDVPGRPADIVLYDVITRRFALKTASAVVATSDFERLQISRAGVNEKRIKLIPLGIHIPTGLARNNIDLESPQILAVGRITPIRNYELLLRAFKLVLLNRPQSRLLIAGGFIPGRYDSVERGYWASLRQLASELRLNDDTIEFLGQVGRDELSSLYATSELLVCTSRYENFCLPILEAASYGLPIVSSRVGVVQDLARIDSGPIIVDSDRPEDFAVAILSALSDRSSWKTRSDCLRESSLCFSADVNCKEHEKLYCELVQQESA